MDFSFLVPPDMTALSVAILLAASFASSLITGLFGIGGGLILIALMAQMMPAAALIPVHGFVQLGANVGRVVIMMREIVWYVMPGFLIGSVIGAALGGALYVNIPSWLIQLAIGLFILWSLIGKIPTVDGKKVALTGFVSTFLTMFFGSTGNFIAAIVRAMRLDPMRHVATHSALMSVQHALKIVTFGFLGFAYAPYVPFIVAMIVVGFVGAVIAKAMLARAGGKYFKPVFTAILAILALRLIWMGAKDLFVFLGLAA